jgi:hypothetical protein
MRLSYTISVQNKESPSFGLVLSQKGLVALIQVFATSQRCKGSQFIHHTLPSSEHLPRPMATGGIRGKPSLYRPFFAPSLAEHVKKKAMFPSCLSNTLSSHQPTGTDR